MEINVKQNNSTTNNRTNGERIGLFNTEVEVIHRNVKKFRIYTLWDWVHSVFYVIEKTERQIWSISF